MVGSPNFVRFVYDGDASDAESPSSTGSGVVEDVFVDYLDPQGLASELTFAQTTSAIEGNDKGKAQGHGEFQGSSLRR